MVLHGDLEVVPMVALKLCSWWLMVVMGVLSFDPRRFGVIGVGVVVFWRQYGRCL